MLDANTFYKQKFGKKMYKASLSLDVTCPNRDGRCGTGGCIFCSEGGSGEFADLFDGSREAIDRAIARVSRKAGPGAGYIAYFQSFTSTYAPAEYLKRMFDAALSHPQIEALDIATRPDCLDDDIMKILEDEAGKAPLFVELGLQTSSDETAVTINRGYNTAVYDEAVRKLHGIGANVITHVILGLPGESRDMMLDTVRHAVGEETDGIKFTCLYVLEGTALDRMWQEGKVQVLEMDEYFDIVDEALNVLPEGTVVHRLTGDGPKRILLAPAWSADKRGVVNYINRRFKS